MYKITDYDINEKTVKIEYTKEDMEVRFLKNPTHQAFTIYSKKQGIAFTLNTIESFDRHDHNLKFNYLRDDIIDNIDKRSIINLEEILNNRTDNMIKELWKYINRKDILKSFNKESDRFLYFYNTIQEKIKQIEVKEEREKSLHADNIIKNIIDIGRTVDPEKWTIQDAISKLFEEGGEFSCAIQTKIGKLKKDYEEGDDFLECADVIMCAIDTLSQANLDMDRDLLLNKLYDSIANKSKKWLTKIEHTKK